MIYQSKVMTNIVYNAVVSSTVNGVAQGYQGPAYTPPIITPVKGFSTMPNMSQSAPHSMQMQSGGGIQHHNSPGI